MSDIKYKHSDSKPFYLTYGELRKFCQKAVGRDSDASCEWPHLFEEETSFTTSTVPLDTWFSLNSWPHDGPYMRIRGDSKSDTLLNKKDCSTYTYHYEGRNWPVTLV